MAKENPSGGKGRSVSLRAGLKPSQADCLKQCSGEGRGIPESKALIRIPFVSIPPIVFLYIVVGIPLSVFLNYIP